MVNDKSERYQNQDEKKHIHDRIAVLCEIDIQLRGKNDKRKNKRQNWSRPNKNQDTQDDIKAIPERESNRSRNIIVNTCKDGKVSLFCPLEHCYAVRINKVKRDSKTQEIWPDVKHASSIQNYPLIWYSGVTYYKY
jgi:hypothetical protein